MNQLRNTTANTIANVVRLVEFVFRIACFRRSNQFLVMSCLLGWIGISSGCVVNYQQVCESLVNPRVCPNCFARNIGECRCFAPTTEGGYNETHWHPMAAAAFECPMAQNFADPTRQMEMGASLPSVTEEKVSLDPIDRDHRDGGRSNAVAWQVADDGQQVRVIDPLPRIMQAGATSSPALSSRRRTATTVRKDSFTKSTDLEVLVEGTASELDYYLP